MKHPIQILLLFLSLSVLTFSQENTETEFPTDTPGAESYNPCDPNNQPQTCTEESAPVCGYIHNCEGGDCTSTFGNSCNACSQANVDGYVDGDCEEARTNCDSNNRPELCPLNYVPACAVAANCQGPNCLEDVSHSCVACSLDNVAYSLPGPCPDNGQDQRSYCEWNDRPEGCTDDYTSVCAHRMGCVGTSCYFTKGNACGACSDGNVDYHIPGECSENEEVRTNCDADDRPTSCTEEFSPVCAHRTDCQGDGCYYTVGNACTACANSAVDWHTEGKCLNEVDREDQGDKVICNPDNRPRNCYQQAYNPVCAHRPGCESGVCEYTAGNHCSACNDIYVSNQTPGEC